MELLPPLRPGYSESFPYRMHKSASTQMAFFDEGDRHAPAVLFIHGLGGNRTHFEHVAPPLVARGHRVLGVDLPGCYDSPRDPAEDVRYTVDSFADRIVRLLDELAIDGVHLAGHSLGGMVATSAALRWPARVRSLTIIDGAGFHRYPAPLALAARALHPKLVAKVMERFALRLLLSTFWEHNENVRRFVGQAEGRAPYPTLDDFAHVACRLLPELAKRNFLDELDRIRLPTLVLWGDEDRLLPFAGVAEWVARLPNARLHVVRACGHMPIIERPEEVVAEIARHVAAAAPASSKLTTKSSTLTDASVAI